MRSILQLAKAGQRLCMQAPCRFMQSESQSETFVISKPIKRKNFDIDINKINTITAIDVSVPTITFLNFDLDKNVLNWDFAQMEMPYNKKYDFRYFANTVEELFENIIPKTTTLYLFENRTYKYRDKKKMELVVNVQHLEMFVKSYIKYRLTDKQFYEIDSNRIAKHFGILIGNERVMSAKTVDSILQPNKYQLLNVPRTLVRRYMEDFDDKAYIKEPLAKTYLLSSFFYEIFLEKQLKKQTADKSEFNFSAQ